VRRPGGGYPQAAGGVRGSGAAAGRGRCGRGSAGDVAGAVSHDVAPGAGGRCDTGTAGPGDTGADCWHGEGSPVSAGSRPGRPVTASASAKRGRRYEARGVAGMADHRTGKPASPHGQVDPAVAEAMRQAIAEAEQESSRTATYLFWRTGQILEAAHGRGAVE